MEKPIITAALSLALLTSGSLALGATDEPTVLQSQTVIATGQAGGGHESIESLKAEIAGLQTKLESTEAGRSYLKGRLENVLNEPKDDSELQRAVKGREFLSAQSKRNREKLMTERKTNARSSLALERALRGRAYLKTKHVESEKENARLSLALERALRGRAYLKSKNVDAEKKDARQSLALERALRGRDYLKSKNVDAEKKDARQSLALERALRGRDYLKSKNVDAEKKDARQSLALERALRGRAYLKSKNIEAEKKDARQSLALERALRGRAYLRTVVDELEEAASQTESEAQELAEVSFAQINSAIAERDSAKQMISNSDWADNLSSDLSATFSDLDGTEVTSLSNNSVSIKVGNTGLFSLGGVALSTTGKDLLSQIGTALADRRDANIKFVGHTDNIPTGSASRFANNEALSLARATSALTYMSSIGISAERLSVAGFGAAYPIASNDTEEGQIANRRVELVLTPAN